MATLKHKMNRRAFINAAGALPLVALPTLGYAANLLTNTNNFPALKMSNDDTFKTYIRFMGSLEPATIYSWFSGYLWGIIPNEAPKPLTTLQGLAKSNWRIEGEHITKESFDLGFFGDLETGNVLESWKNPYTNETVKPFHFMYGGGHKTVYTPQGIKSGENIKPYKTNWIQSGNQVWLDEYGSHSFKNPIQPDEWPISSAGEQLHFGSSTTYIANADELFNDTLPSCDQSFFWTAVNSWEPWLRMRQREGFVMWRATGRKIMDISEIPDAMKHYVKKVQPNYFKEETPWKGRRSTYKSYKKLREGEQ